MEDKRLFIVEDPKRDKTKVVIPSHAIAMKYIELLLACTCWMTYSSGIEASCLHIRYAVANATFGAFVIIGTIVLIGYLLAQPMPRILQITCDCIAFTMLLSSGMLMVESWWRFEIESLEGSRVIAGIEERGANLRLGVGLLSLCAAAFHLADAFINIIRKNLTEF